MKLLSQPGDGVAPLIRGIDVAKKSIEIVIFRFDRPEVERALKKAASRGVFIHALIAYTNRGGEKNLRKLEMRLLAAGVSVARTAGDLARYHDKLMIIDRKILYLLAFNFTYLDIGHSRSFGLITKNRKLVQEAVRLFEADTKRQPYTASFDSFVVSPVNARRALAAFIKGAKKQLLIYDVRISDPAMARLLGERARAGVEIKIIGRLTRRAINLDVRRLARLRLHTRTIIRDRSAVFLGSQSLRALELDARREVGVIFRDARVVNNIIKTFDEDWESGLTGESPAEETTAIHEPLPAAKTAKKVAKAVAGELPPVSSVLERIVTEAVGKDVELHVDCDEVEKTLKQAVKGAVRDAVEDIVQQVADQKGIGKP
ncbi:MAG: phospholipase D-like domain-containing protein [Terriglobia bacterium]